MTLGAIVSACRRAGNMMSGASRASTAEAGATAPVAAASAHAAPPPAVKSAAPKAPTRSASLTCPATPADAKPFYERCNAGVRDCARVAVVADTGSRRSRVFVVGVERYRIALRSRV